MNSRHSWVAGLREAIKKIRSHLHQENQRGARKVEPWSESNGERARRYAEKELEKLRRSGARLGTGNLETFIIQEKTS